MNMWKKTMTATVACLMTFSLAACGSSDEGKTAGVSGDIKVYTRDSSSGTREAFEKGVDFEGSLTKNAIEVSSNDDMAAKEPIKTVSGIHPCPPISRKTVSALCSMKGSQRAVKAYWMEATSCSVRLCM
jgi:hypothetical protein